MGKKYWHSIVVCIGILFFGAGLADAAGNAPPLLSPVMTLKGSWEDIGRQTAYYFPNDIITGSLIFNMMLGVEGEEARDYYAEIKSLIPAGVDEQMQGVATGLSEYWRIPHDTAWDMVLIWNLGMEIYAKHKLEQAAGCTAFALKSDAGMFLSHNTDNQPGTESMSSVFEYVPDTGEQSFVSFFSPGFCGAALGANQSGLALTYNVGRPNKNPQTGVPPIFIAHDVLAQCATLDEAVAMFQAVLDNGGHYSHQGANIMIVDFDNQTMAWLQICSDEMRVVYGKELKPGVTYLACTNHFDQDFSPLSAEDNETASNISSRERLKRLMELLPQQQVYDLAACLNILSDHGDGEPTNDTLCRRGSSSATTMTNVFTSDKAYYTLGLPCEYLEAYDRPQEIELSAVVKPAIAGRVQRLGKTLPQAKIELSGGGRDGISLTTYTDIEGRFNFNNLPAGSYALKAKKQSKMFPLMYHTLGYTVIEYDGVTSASVSLKTK